MSDVSEFRSPWLGSVRSLLLLLFLTLAVAAMGFGWWYFRGTPSESLVRQQSALDGGIKAFKEGQFNTALEELRQVSSDYPDAWRARYYEGSAKIMLKDYNAAIPLLEQALTLNPTHTRTMHALGVAHFKLGHLAIAKAYFAQVLEIDPTDEEARGLMNIMASLERQQPANSVDTEN